MYKIHRHLWLMFLCFLPTLAWAQTDGWATRTPTPARFSALSDPVAKSDTLIVEDYRGPDGNGDQGGYVLVTFKHTTQHAQLARHRIWREILVSIDVDANGRITALTTPALRWVPWAVVEAKPVGKGEPPLTQAVIATIDNVATRWAITAEMGNDSSPLNINEEYVKETLALLGVQSAMRQPELEKIIGPAYDFMPALLGEQKDLLVGKLDLDGLRRVAMRIPEGVHAQASGIKASDATLAAKEIRAIDNIPPATVDLKAEVSGRQVTLTWKASWDDRVVGLIPYRGYAVPIPGVRSYNVLRSMDGGQSFVNIASLASGATSFKDEVDPILGNNLVYRIDPVDLDNATPSERLVVDLPDPRSIFSAGDEKNLTATQTPKTPTEFVLRQNFPNPFNPATTIKYDLAESGKVQLHIYSVTGQVVRTLVNGPQAAGRYQILWDGNDDRGISVSSGMYFYRLTAEKFTSVKKLMLLK